MNWKQYSAVLLEKSKQNEVPFAGCFELTPFCNFSCNMCYIRLTPEQAKAQGKLLSTEQWLQLAYEAKKAGTISLEITGGEAVTRPDFPLLYESIMKMGFLVILRTNGYAISGDILELLKRYRPRRIGITFYGASDETYKRVSGVSDGFSVVSKNVLAMRDAGLNLRLTMTLTNDNIGDREALKKWGEENHFEITSFAGLFTPIRGAKRSIEDKRVKFEDVDCTMVEEMKTIEISNNDRSLYLNPFWMCNAFGSTYCISWDGRMTLCNAMTAVWKNPINDGLIKAYHDLYDELKRIKRPSKCENCQFIEHCASCPTFFLSETGRLDEVSDEICKKAKRSYIRSIQHK